MNDLEFDPKDQGQQKNQNRAMSMFCRVQDKNGATRGSLALRKEDDLGFYFIGQGKVSAQTWSKLHTYQGLLVLFEVLIE